MDLGLKGKVVVVTAASGGLVRAVATEFGHEGTRVMITPRNEEELQKSVDEIHRQQGPNGVQRDRRIGACGCRQSVLEYDRPL